MKINLELEILKLLEPEGQALSSETMLFNNLNMVITTQAITYTDLRKALNSLEAEGFILRINSKDRGILTTITAKGTARALQ